jgi:translocator protein
MKMKMRKWKKSSGKVMSSTPVGVAPINRPLAAAIASNAFLVPLALSLGSVPSAKHPRTMLWYTSLREPSFKPPDWVFPVAWTGIEAGLALAGYRLLRAARHPVKARALALWGWNVFMIGGWSRLFFKRHALAVSTAAAASLIATSAALVKEAKKVDVPASKAALPLLGWVTFATVLTATIWHLNKRK